MCALLDLYKLHYGRYSQHHEFLGSIKRVFFSMFGIKTWGSTGIGSTPIKIIDPNSGSRKVRNRKHNFETTVAGGDFRSDRTAGGHQVYQPGDVHKTGGMYFLTS
jgi:hypothetical protein